MERYLAGAVAMIALSIYGSGSAYAQAYDRVAPRELPPMNPHADDMKIPPVKGSLLPNSHKVVMASLRGISFVSDPKQIKKDGELRFGMIWDRPPSIAVRSNLNASLKPYFGRKLTMDDVNAMARTIGNVFRSHGRPFVYIAIPPQFLGHGTIQFVVMEYHLSKVTVKGNKWFSSRLIRSGFGLKPGQRLSLDDVRAGIERLNGNPFRSVDAVFSPGQERGSTDVLLRTKDKFPLHGYGSYDTGGIPLMGRQEYMFGGTWGNVAGLGHTLSYQFTHSTKDVYSSHSLNYMAPLPWGDTIRVFGSYSWERPSEYYMGTRFVEGGHSGQASIRYIHTFYPRNFLSNKLTLWQEVQGGFDFKTTNNSIEFGGLSVYATQANTDQFPLIYSATLRDPFGETIFRNQLTLSPGNMMGGNNRRSYQAIVPGASPDYAYDTMTLSRTTWIPGGLSWAVQATGQVSTTNLMYSNQLGLGGLYTTRGYFTDTALGSQGVTLSNEIYSPAWSIRKGWDTEQIGVFFDYGHVSQVKAIPNQVNSIDLSSVGVDAKLRIRNYLSVSFNVGWRLNSLPMSRRDSGYGDKGAFGNVSITVGF